MCASIMYGRWIIRNEYKMLDGKSERRRSLGKHMLRSKDNTNKDLTEIELRM
jgi:hypothetical protein